MALGNCSGGNTLLIISEAAAFMVAPFHDAVREAFLEALPGVFLQPF